MNIGRAAVQSGVTAKMIRYYESVGLIPCPDRTAANYRDYDETDLQRLSFVRRARNFGFSVERIRELMSLWSHPNRCSAEVKAVALQHIAELERKIDQMRHMADALRALAEACEGDDRPECPIIDDLESGLGASARSRARPAPQ